MTNNQLPEGVGKKIVEALKRQAEADIAPINESEMDIINNVPLTKIEDIAEINYEDISEVATINEDIIIEEAPIETLKEPAMTIMEEVAQPVSQPQDTYKKTVLQSSNIAVPANVVKLNNLINTLPAGVTKQTGALIIKQTLEAMGLPINAVLKEAQMFQEELNNSTKECMIKIQEAKNQIMQLENMVQSNQENVAHVNDIVSLFI
jgi:hypothetical protein